MAITIDDAPHGEVTPYLLDELRRHECRATFFCIGAQVAAAPKALLRRMVDEGHELGNHMMHDMATIKLSSKDFETELLAVEELLDSFQPMHQRPVKWFRPGCGWYNREMIKAANAHGYTVALGDCYPFDVNIKNATVISRYIKWKVRDGSVIIVHDGRKERRFTIDVLKSVLPHLKENGFEVVTLSELMASS